MSKKCFIEQSCGLGDILLACKIGHHFAAQGHEVIWPVQPVYANLSSWVNTEGFRFANIASNFKYKEQYQEIVSRQSSEVIETADYIFAPLRRSFFSNTGQELSKSKSHDAANMHGKFTMCNLTHHGWQDYFEIIRNEENEQKLCEQLELSQTKYHIVNKNFGTPPKWKEELNKDIHTPFPEKRVEMFMSPEYSVFDWLKIFENASRIDTVSTSTFYLFEKIELNCIPTIYSRNNSDRSYAENFNWLEDLARKQYLFIS